VSRASFLLDEWPGTVRGQVIQKGIGMLAALLILLLLILLFGGLGLYVAKLFFVALLVVLLVSLATGGMYIGRRR